MTEDEVPPARAEAALAIGVARKSFLLRTRDVLMRAETLAEDLRNAIGDVSVDEAYAAWSREVKLFVDEGR